MTQPWPTGQDAWIAYAARCTAHYPLMASDWDQHAEIMKARRNAAIEADIAGVQNRSSEALPAWDGVHIFADEPPLSPEEEESLSSSSSSFPTPTTEPAQMELF